MKRTPLLVLAIAALVVAAGVIVIVLSTAPGQRAISTATVLPSTSPSPSPSDSSGCIVSGCSSQVCGDRPIITTCEWRQEFICYRLARCERQANGQCGWTQTPELTSCLAQFK